MAGPQWSIGDVEGMQRAISTELPAWMAAAIRQMAGAAKAKGQAASQNLREYDPEWGEAFVSGRATLTCDHETMLRLVKVPVLFTHHFRHVDPDTGHLIGAISDLQAARVRQLVEAAGNAFAYQVVPGDAPLDARERPRHLRRHCHRVAGQPLGHRPGIPTEHSMSTILVIGASTGIGNLTARTLASAGHAVYAGMRGPPGATSQPPRPSLTLSRCAVGALARATAG